MASEETSSRIVIFEGNQTGASDVCTVGAKH